MAEPSNVPWNEGTFGSSPSAVNLTGIIRENLETHHQASKFSCFLNKFRAALHKLEDIQDISTREMFGELLYQTKKESVAKLDVETVPEFKTHCLCVLAGVWRGWKRVNCTQVEKSSETKWRKIGNLGTVQRYHLSGLIREEILRAKVDHENGENFVLLDAWPARVKLNTRSLEQAFQMMLEAGEPMEYSLLDRLEALEKENADLKQQNAELEDKAATLELEKEFIEHQLNKVNTEHVRLQLDSQRTEILLNQELEVAHEATKQAKESARIWRKCEKELAIDLEDSREDGRLWRGHWEEERLARKKSEEELAQLKRQLGASNEALMRAHDRYERLRKETATHIPHLFVHDEINIEFDPDDKISLMDRLQEHLKQKMLDSLSFISPIQLDAILPTSYWKTKEEKASPAPQKYRAWAKEMEKYREARKKRD